ncbi:MAG: 2Fe-2S iron-sulfur cluster-binding protein [Burkholderiales bacterium]|nr:2Fe-2S iron-sulfur cluster-binding protein [Burkholderiales bacterium]
MSDVTFTFEGHPVVARTGQTVGAALAAAGQLALRETRNGAARGIFCGMGVCQECLVTVDGMPNRRACIEPARDGIHVRRQAFPGEPPGASRGAPPIGFDDLAVERADVIVIGGGAGGLAVAIAARGCGLDVLLLDERSTAGGQYYKQPAAALREPALDRQQADGAALRARAERGGVRILDGAEVVTAIDAGAVLATRGGRAFVARGRALAVATGAYERGVPLPGWTLPGVMTTGALQTLWRSYRALPGRRLLIAGNGPLNLQVACESMDAGATVVAVAEAAPLAAGDRLGALTRMALADPALAARGGGYLARLRSQSRLRLGVVCRHIEPGPGGGLRVETGRADGGPGETHDVDAVALGYGFQPSNELLRALGCEHDWDARSGMLRTRRTATCETTVAGVFAVGDCCGLGGAPAALAEGTIAGVAVGRALGGSVPASLSQEADRAARDLARHRRFQAALWEAFAAPRLGLSLAAADTVVCRCEDVGKAELLAAAADGDPAIGDVKRRTRCGMGRCQGRYCGPALAEHLAGHGDRPLDGRAFFAPRGPVKPVTIADLVGGAGR